MIGEKSTLLLTVARIYSISCEKWTVDSHSTDADAHLSADTESLLKKLVEAEVDGQAIADNSAGFIDAIQRLREVSIA